MTHGRLTPFLVTGGPVPPEDVVDREAYLEGTTARLRDGHSIYISGPRRTGKSSVAGALLDGFRRDGFYTCQLDLFAVTDQADFAQRLAEAVLANRRGGWHLARRPLSLEPSVSAKGFPPEIKVALGFKVGSPDPEPATMLDRALELPEQVAQQDRRGMVVAFDEFQEVEKLGGIELLKRMRAHFQRHRSVVYVFLGSQGRKLRQMFGAAAEPFFRFAEPSRLPDVPRRSWSAYLEARFADRGLTIPVAILSDLLDATGGHPADTMLVASHVYYAARDSRSTEVTSALLQAGYGQALDDVGQYFDVLWAGLGRGERTVAHSLVETGQPYARSQVPPSGVARAMRTLEDLGLAHRLGPRRWGVAEPMFADWLRRA
ncbi:MAG: hypothetical protein U0893_24920 [Chloroflexota bacterium]